MPDVLVDGERVPVSTVTITLENGIELNPDDRNRIAYGNREVSFSAELQDQ